MINDPSSQAEKQTSPFGNYILHNEIGEGANGHIYKATQQATGQIVAIKTIKFRDEIDEQKKKSQIDRFEREARLCAGINHPNIVKILDKGLTEAKEPFAIFEYVAGITLKEYILQNTVLSVQETGLLMGQVLDALVSAHKIGIVHRDLKPHNIMVSNLETKRHVKILDFGISAFAHDTMYFNHRGEELSTDFQGTPAYSAPEQLRGEPPTVKSDLYAWGLIFIECLTGKPVMTGTSIAEIFEMQLSPVEIFMPTTLSAHPLGQLLRKVLDKKQENRPENTLKLYEEFEALDLFTLSGNIKMETEAEAMDGEYTIANDVVMGTASSTRKQLTVLCLKLSLSISKGVKLDLEALDTLQRDLLNICKDSATKFGGFVVGSLINNMVVYFGYPVSSDSDARKAGRTALELINEGNKRNALLFEQYRVTIAMSVSLHTGTMLIQANRVPEGNVPNTALNLLNCTPAGSVLVSATSKKLLDSYLEFEPAETLLFTNEVESIPTFKLTGERQAEALSFQKAWKQDRAFVGREKERNNILTDWNRVLDGKGCAVLMSGQAGIGKSRLVYEIQKEIHTGEVRECRCLPEHQNNALYPFLFLFKNQWGIIGCETNDAIIQHLKIALSNSKCALDESLPLLCLWLSIPLPSGYSIKEINPVDQKKILFDVLKDCLFGIYVERPLFIAIDDLHWMDSISLEFIYFILKDIEQQRCLLMMTSRPEFVHKWEVEGFKQMELEPLNGTFTEAMIVDVLGGKSISSSALGYISERSDSIPFFVEELTDMLLEQHYLVLKGDTYELVGDINKKSVPITLHALLNTRLEKLGLAKETAQLASAIGREFNYELLVKASVKDEASVQSDLNQMLRADIVYKQRRVSGDNYVFRHALIQTAAYESLISAFKREVHGRIAETLKDYFPEISKGNPFEIGRHLAEAACYDEAVVFCIKAIEILIQRGLYTETSKIVQLSKTWIEKIEKDQDRKIAQLNLNDVLITVLLNTEGLGTASFIDIYEQNKKLIAYFDQYAPNEKKSNFDQILLKSHCLYLNHLHISNQRSKAWEVSEEVLPIIKNLEDYKLRLLIRASIGQMYLCEGRFDESVEILGLLIKEGIEIKNYLLFHTLGFDPVPMSYGDLACINSVFGNYVDAIKNADLSINYATKVNNALDIIISYVFKGLAFGLFDMQKEAAALLASLRELHPEMLAACWATCYLDFIEDWVAGEVDKSLVNRKILIDTCQDALLTWYEMLIMDTLLKKKQYEKVFELMTEAEIRNKSRNENCLLAMVYTYLGISYSGIKGGQENILSDFFEKAIIIAESQRNDWFVMQAIYNYHESILRCGFKFTKPELIQKAKQLSNNFKVDNNQIRKITDYFNNLNN